MRICAVICELNPLHNGHEYIFSEAKRISGADKLIALMSGDFVQRATPAVADEYARAECALKCGADAVIELPAVYATASAERFASGAVGILNTIRGVDSLVMGVETDDAYLLTVAAEVQREEPAEFTDALRSALDSGMPYPKAVTVATAVAAEKRDVDPDLITNLLVAPNNKLAVEYKKALLTSGSNIRFIPVKRMRGENIRSAAELRTGPICPANISFMPQASFDIIKRESAAHSVSYSAYGTLIVHTLRSVDLSRIADTPDCAEGLEYRIKKAAERLTSYEEVVGEVCGARYTKGRIMRICLHTLLGITKQMQCGGYAFARLLGIRKDSENLLRTLPSNILKTKADERYLPANCAQYEVDKRAVDIYSVLSRYDGNCFYRKLLTV